MIGGAQVVLVAVLMDGAIGTPTAGALPALRIAVGGKAPVWPDEKEKARGEFTKSGQEDQQH